MRLSRSSLSSSLSPIRDAPAHPSGGMLDPFSDIRSDNSTNAQWAVRILRALNPFSEIMSGTTANAQWAVRNHASARQIEQGMIKTGRDPDNYVFFTPIRNPWARTFSAYKFGLKDPNSTWHIPAVSAGRVDGFVRHPHVIRQLRKHALDQMSTPRVHVFPIETSMELLVPTRFIACWTKFETSPPQ